LGLVLAFASALIGGDSILLTKKCGGAGVERHDETKAR